jgi:hypothetical protein
MIAAAIGRQVTRSRQMARSTGSCGSRPHVPLRSAATSLDDHESVSFSRECV